MKERENFDALKVPLAGSNLIEASAGTGKTYSISILVLRLILEKKLSIREILMVTFTKAAIAELEERIRIFIRAAYRKACDEDIEDTTISKLVMYSVDKIGKDETQKLLHEAVIYLDETSVLTIHSFCQQTLSEFAFETKQIFGTEILQDTSSLLLKEVQKFWRKYITVIPVSLLKSLIKSGLSIDSIKMILKNHLSGKRFQHFNSEAKYSIGKDSYKKAISEIERGEIVWKQHLESVEKFLIDNKADLVQRSQKGYAKRSLLPIIDDHESFLNYVSEKEGSGYIQQGFEDILTLIANRKVQEQAYNQIFLNILNQIYCVAIIEISQGVSHRKINTGQLSYDDLIENLYNALLPMHNAALVGALQKKYKAVFIDEFQDTDRLQYEIFHEAFGKPTEKNGEKTILFYIGDPKQSIYSFRKADIFTYFRAYNDVEHIYEMNINYRSTENYILAMNNFFMPEEGFDTFYFKDRKDAIIYFPVNSPAKNEVGNLMFGGAACVPISIDYNFKNKPDIQRDVAKLVFTLLTDESYKIVKSGGQLRKILPSDIGILVRNKSEGFGLQSTLAKYHIPTVTTTDAKVLSSNEAQELFYLLEAFLNNSRQNINRALLSSFTGYNSSTILQLDFERNMHIFSKYKAIWEKEGIYNAIKNFISDFGIQKHLLEKNTENGERIITNLYQLTELLFRAQHTQNLAPLDLLDWLKRAIEQDDAVGDELEQRIENDEDAVKIVTIHSSKGLQYNIVLAPFLDFNTDNKNSDASYRDENTSEYISGIKNQFTDEQKEIVALQVEQENRRLLYVAITRAVFKIFIYKNENPRFKNSTLSYFTNSSSGKFKEHLIEKKKPIELPDNSIYESIIEKPSRHPLTLELLPLEHISWINMSYTMLAAESENRLRAPAGNSKTIYDQFIYKELTRGNITGNLLHFIFENINFSSDSNWGSIVERAIRRFAPSQKEKYELKILELIMHVLGAELIAEDLKFNLTEINFDKRIHELEFDFPVNEFNPQLLSDLGDENIVVNVKQHREMEGVMNGKIDMFFEYGRQYFVLDWKSTFLGDTLDHYTVQALKEAMNDHNYHLQYLIYSLAAKKYLESRLPDFDYQRNFGGVFYLFVRGMRAEKNEGVFFTKPSLKTIEQLEALLSYQAVNV